MQIQIDIDQDSQLTTFSVEGELDFNELLAFIETHHAQSGHTERCLWDFRSITGGDQVSVLQMGQFYGLCSKYFYGEHAHRLSFVVGDHMGFGFAQVLSTFEELYDLYLCVRVFKDIEVAMGWLEEGSL